MRACSIDGCARPFYANGVCNAHYASMIRRGRLDAKPPRDAQSRLEERSVLVPMCGCRLWFGASVPSGYGVIHFDGRQQYTHRVAWQLVHGPIEKGLIVLHRCDTPACINVDHLRIGTTRDNYEDMISKGRNRNPGAPRGFKHPNPSGRGEANPCASLTNEQAIKIRNLYATKTFKQWDLAHMFGVKQATISRIVRQASY